MKCLHVNIIKTHTNDLHCSQNYASNFAFFSFYLSSRSCTNSRKNECRICKMKCFRRRRRKKTSKNANNSFHFTVDFVDTWPSSTALTMHLYFVIDSGEKRKNIVIVPHLQLNQKKKCQTSSRFVSFSLQRCLESCTISTQRMYKNLHIT